RQLSVALVGMGRHLDSGCKCLSKALESAVVASCLGELIETAFRLLNLIPRSFVDGSIIGGIDHLLANHDQRSAKGEVVDSPAVVRCVDDGRSFGSEAREILACRQSGDVQI